MKESINIGVGSAAGMLNEMIQFPIQLEIPDIELLSALELRSELEKRFGIAPLASVQLEFSSSFSGNAQLLFPTESAVNLVSVLTGKKREVLTLMLSRLVPSAKLVI